MNEIENEGRLARIETKIDAIQKSQDDIVSYLRRHDTELNDLDVRVTSIQTSMSAIWKIFGVIQAAVLGALGWFHK